MDFFEHQDLARRKTGRLVGLFIVAVIAIIVLVDLAVGAALLVAGWTADHSPLLIFVNPVVMGIAAVSTLIIVGGGSLAKIAQLQGGGTVVAESLGGRPVRPGSLDRTERRVLNVVEEMAIASGMPTPPVYVMDDEPGINAFAAGYAPDDAVVAVTRGTVERLSRDELQGVIAHEFSHILNGDMRLNIRLIGVLHGILVLGILGAYLFRSLRYVGGGRRSRTDGRVVLAVGALAGGLILIGSIGTFFGNLIKAAVSRQREFLADASAVQFTRAPHGIAGALKKIGGAASGSSIRSPNAPQASHMFFGQGVSFAVNALFATHPPLPDRIRRIEPSWDGKFVASTAPAAVSTSADPRAAGIASTATSRQTQRRRRVIDGDAVVESLSSIGQPTPAHLEYARALRQSFSESISSAAHEPYGARAVVYALLMSQDETVRGRQFELLGRRSDDGIDSETARLLPETDALDDRQRLPLIDLTLPALRSMTRRQFVRFARTVTDLVAADETIDQFEWLLQRVVRRHITAHFSPVQRERIAYYGLGRLRHQLGVVLSTLAHAGNDQAEEAKRAFDAGATKLDPVPVGLLPPEGCTRDALDDALDELNKVAPRLKRLVLGACAAVIIADGQCTVHEIELARAIADTLGVPVPPVVG